MTHHFDQLKFHELFSSSPAMLRYIHFRSRLLMLIPALNMLDGNDGEVWGSL
jgi:hypothetical protein